MVPQKHVIKSQKVVGRCVIGFDIQHSEWGKNSRDVFQNLDQPLATSRNLMIERRTLCVSHVHYLTNVRIDSLT